MSYIEGSSIALKIVDEVIAELKPIRIPFTTIEVKTPTQRRWDELRKMVINVEESTRLAEVARRTNSLFEAAVIDIVHQPTKKQY